MPEDQDYSPGAWSGYDYGAAATVSYARTYSNPDTRTQRATQAANKNVPASVSTNCENPLVVAVDVTGSMGKWPAVIFGKLPYLDNEARASYLGADGEISFVAVGDNQDKFPLQVQPFSQGPDLRNRLDQIFLEKGGGNGAREAYELTAAYYARNCDMPNAKRPVMVFIADEMPDSPSAQNFTKHGIRGTVPKTYQEIFEELKTKFAVYLIYLRYPAMDTRTTWAQMLGEDHIVDLDDPTRVVDVLFGIIANEHDKVDLFKTEITSRQTPDQVAYVLSALKNVLSTPAKPYTLDKNTCAPTPKPSPNTVVDPVTGDEFVEIK